VGVCLAFCQVDHANVVVRGLPVLERVFRTGDPAPLRELLRSLPFEEDEELAAYYRERLARLREVDAPPFLIEAEERRLAGLRAPEPEALGRASLAELRALLGGWCREARTLDLDKAWDLVHWYSDPGRRRRALGDWRAQPAGFTPSAFDYALCGYGSYPRDAHGEPVFQTGGNPDESFYNPPEVVAGIAAALAGVAPADWGPLDAEMDAAPEEQRPYLAELDERLEYAREAFDQLRAFYQRAAGRGFGVSVEYY
jgi:hypothetical protein